MLSLLFFIAAFVVFSYVVLRGENLAYLDRPVPRHPARMPGAGMRSVLKELSDFAGQSHGWGRERIRNIRRFMDQMAEGRDYEASFRPLDSHEVRGEWVLAPGHSTS
ncbi:MAG: alpha/beta hydrolase, partial [Pseudomonadota bacterium]